MAIPRRPVAVRFWLRVAKGGPDECWNWTGTGSWTGYGHIGEGGKYGKALMAHHVSWEIHNGPIPSGLCVLHRCDNRPCVNPAHLFLGTKYDNAQDAIRKGRHYTPFTLGHKIRRKKKMTGVEALSHYQHLHVEELERDAELKERQSLELCIEAAELRARAARLRAAIAAGIFTGAAEQ